MCECFKPAFSEYNFAKGIGVLGHRMWEIEHLGYRLLSGVPKDAASCSEQIDRIIDRLDAELTRASQDPFEEIPEFQITWSPASEFRSGYLAGLKELQVGLEGLAAEIRSALSLNPEINVFHEVIATWAEDWQESKSEFNFMNATPLASDVMGQSQIRILSPTRASVVTEEDPTQDLTWLEVEMLEVHPVEDLVSELWKRLAYGDFAIGFTRGNHYISPEAIETELHNFEFASLCDEHWQKVVALNSELIVASGQTPIAN
jgi:hypothetical protein